MQLLHIDSAITGEQSVSRQLTAQIVEAWKASHPATQVSYLDLVADAPAHFTMDAMAPRTGQTDGLSEAQQRENAVSERLVSQFLAADVVVIGAPFYNFAIPTQLKAWIDRIAQPGRTFQYTANGPEGLAKGKTVIVASSRGGVYSTSEGGRAMEHQESYLQTDRAGLLRCDRRALRARRGRGHGWGCQGPGPGRRRPGDRGPRKGPCRQPGPRQPGRLTSPGASPNKTRLRPCRGGFFHIKMGPNP